MVLALSLLPLAVGSLPRQSFAARSLDLEQVCNRIKSPQERQSCLTAGERGHIDPLAVGVCDRMVSATHTGACVRAIAGLWFEAPEVQRCDSQKDADATIDCLRRAGTKESAKEDDQKAAVEATRSYDSGSGVGRCIAEVGRTFSYLSSRNQLVERLCRDTGPGTAECLHQVGQSYHTLSFGAQVDAMERLCRGARPGAAECINEMASQTHNSAIERQIDYTESLCRRARPGTADCIRATAKEFKYQSYDRLIESIVRLCGS